MFLFKCNHLHVQQVSDLAHLKKLELFRAVSITGSAIVQSKNLQLFCLHGNYIFITSASFPQWYKLLYCISAGISIWTYIQLFFTHFFHSVSQGAASRSPRGRVLATAWTGPSQDYIETKETQSHTHSPSHQTIKLTFMFLILGRKPKYLKKIQGEHANSTQ